MLYLSSAEANILRWAPGQKNCYEIYSLTLNHPASRTGYGIRYALHAPGEGGGEPYTEVWFTFFDLVHPTTGFGIVRRFAIESMQSSASPFFLTIGNSTLGNEACWGRVEGDGHSARWDLRFEPCAKPFQHFPEALYGSGQMGSAMLSPHLATSFSGTIQVDGRSFELTGDPGQQSHTWGRRHPPHWMWAHCNSFAEDSAAAMELLVALPEKGHPASLDAHVLYARVGGRDYRLLSLLDRSKSKSTAAPGIWKLWAEGALARIEVAIECRPEDLIQATYVDPDDASTHCVATGVASAALQVAHRSDVSKPWVPSEPLLSKGTTHAEWGDLDPNPDVERRVAFIS